MCSPRPKAIRSGTSPTSADQVGPGPLDAAPGLRLPKGLFAHLTGQTQSEVPELGQSGGGRGGRLAGCEWYVTNRTPWPGAGASNANVAGISNVNVAMWW